MSGSYVCETFFYKTYVESSQPDRHIMSLVPRQRVPDSVVPFVHVLQRHGGVVLDNLGQGGALVEDHAKDDKLQVCSERWIPVDCAGDFFFLVSIAIPHLTMLISVRMYWRTVSTPWKLMTVWSKSEDRGEV